MAGSVFIMGTTADSARLAVVLDLLIRLPANGEKMAYFKPLTGIDEDAPGRATVRAAIRFFAPRAVTRNYHVVGREAAAMERKELIDLIAAKYDKLARAHKWVIIQGSDYLPAPGTFEADLNIEIAQQCGTPVLLVLKASERLPAAVAVEARDVAERLADRKVLLAGVLVNDFFNAQSVYKDALRQLLGDDIPVATVPEINITNLFAPKRKRNITPLIAETLNTLAAGIDITALRNKLLQADTILTGSIFRSRLLENAKRQRARIVLPEGESPRILRAAARFLQLRLGKLILLGNPEKIASRLKQEQIVLPLKNVTIIDPTNNPKVIAYAHILYYLRKSRGMTSYEARELMLDPSYLGCLIVKSNKADAMVSGAVYTTRQTVLPALQIIKGRKEHPLVSSVFFICLPWRAVVFADCAVVPEPTAEQLAEIALSTAETSRLFGIEPRIAMISYSTAASGVGPAVEKVIRATEIVKKKAPDLLIEGPMQYDAAVDPVTAHAKWPGSAVAGRATVFIFPDLNTGNTVYKAVQQATGAIAIGPVLQGLNKPVNDMSRGGSVDDIFHTLLATLVQCRT
jgi:phosphate acetyltransferase